MLLFFVLEHVIEIRGNEKESRIWARPLRLSRPNYGSAGSTPADVRVENNEKEYLFLRFFRSFRNWREFVMRARVQKEFQICVNMTKKRKLGSDDIFVNLLKSD